MTLEQYYYIAELVAAVALIISLIYVGIQVRLSAKATQAATAQSYVDTMNSYVGLINSSRNLAKVLHGGANGLDNLQDEEVIQFCAFHDQCFITFEAFYFEWKHGLLAEQLWDTYHHVIISLLVQPGQQEYWQMRRHWYDDEFQGYVEGLLEQGGEVPMHFKSIGAAA
jgi:hypothetical protein